MQDNVQTLPPEILAHASLMSKGPCRPGTKAPPKISDSSMSAVNSAAANCSWLQGQSGGLQMQRGEGDGAAAAPSRGPPPPIQTSFFRFKDPRAETLYREER